jgi:hypothetical protein
MGYGTYSDTSYRSFSTANAGATTNQLFTNTKIDESRKVDNLTVREARDSEDHPKSFPIIVGLDVTGSMGYIPTEIIKNGLGTLVGDAIKGGIPDPAIMFLAIGDQHYDSAPIQVGQFESSDQLLVESLKTIYIERGGGGDQQESYLLAWYVAANYTATDNWDKRGKKGLLITIGDEGNHAEFDTEKKFFGVGQGTKYTDKELLESAQEKWDIYHIHANDANYNVATARGQQVLNYWKDALGQNVIVINNHKDIPAKIAELIIQHEAGSVVGKVEAPIETKEDKPAPNML